MASKEDYKGDETMDFKKLQTSLQTFEAKNQSIAGKLKKLETTKKEKDAKPTMETLHGELKESLEALQQLEKEMKDMEMNISKKLGRKEEPKELKEPKEEKKKVQVTPEQQELTYELKQQLMRNVEMQNQKLRTELTLHEKMNETKMLSEQNRKLHEDINLTRTNSLNLIKMFEKKAKDADHKLKEMKAELTKSQELVKKLQQMYAYERRKNLTSSQKPRDDGDVEKIPELEGLDSQRGMPASSYSFLGTSQRVKDVIRKNEVLVEENSELKREIKRLKEDNAYLIKKTKIAMADKDAIIMRLDTSEANRKELLKRLGKEKMQHQTLSRSLTRQASDWILLKKQIAQFDEDYRWGQVGSMNPQGAEQRVNLHTVTRNVYLPRKMFPVEQYADANKTSQC